MCAKKGLRMLSVRKKKLSIITKKWTHTEHAPKKHLRKLSMRQKIAFACWACAQKFLAHAQCALKIHYLQYFWKHKKPHGVQIFQNHFRGIQMSSNVTITIKIFALAWKNVVRKRTLKKTPLILKILIFLALKSPTYRGFMVKKFKKSVIWHFSHSDTFKFSLIHK